MKALILNSGMGKRMGVLTSEHPKCMTEISACDTILSRQLKLLCAAGVDEVVMTTGLFREVLTDYCESLHLQLKYTFVNNPIYDKTNYIYSMYLAREQLCGDMLLMHGDLVFDESVLREVAASSVSCMTVSSTLPLPEKDFKAVVAPEGERMRICKVGIEFFDHAVAAQPLYLLRSADWEIWKAEISRFCEEGTRGCYAENAFNLVSDKCAVYALDTKDRLCGEIDTADDLEIMRKRVESL